MCGIAGIIGPQDEAWILAMNDVQVHRGPDGDGIYRDGPQVSLAQRRLAIVDVTGGRQPMSTADGRHTLVFNGEIFNAPELRRELEEAGAAFTTDHSDTEVLLHLLVRDGAAAIPRLNGMFAFAFYDRASGRLLCARDRFGIKPFHWVTEGGRFAFASEVKSLRRLPFVGSDIDAGQLAHYLGLHYTPGPGSIVRGVQRLPAGHLLVLEPGAIPVIERWWRPIVGQGPRRSREEWRHLLRAELDVAVTRWTMADVPIACSLSGGLDSPTVVAMMARGGKPPATFSVGFSGPGEAEWSELPLARAVADKWGTDHHEIIVDPESLMDDLIAMVWALDEPYAGGLPSWAVFREIAGAGVKVAMTGTGGDELFGNYGQWRPVERDLRGLLPVLAPLGASSFRRRFHDKAYYLPEGIKRRRVLAEGVAPDADTAAVLYRFFAEAGAGRMPRDRIAALDVQTQLPEEFLMMTDRFSMAHSLEARTPFLDARLAELALSIPGDERTGRADPKALLRETVADLLPPAILTAPKKGFTLPLALWLRGRLKPLCDRLLAPDRLKRQALLRPDFHQRFVRPHAEGKANHTGVIWPALMFQLWHLVFVDEACRSHPTFTVRDLT